MLQYHGTVQAHQSGHGRGIPPRCRLPLGQISLLLISLEGVLLMIICQGAYVRCVEQVIHALRGLRCCTMYILKY